MKMTSASAGGSMPSSTTPSDFVGLVASASPARFTSPVPAIAEPGRRRHTVDGHAANRIQMMQRSADDGAHEFLLVLRSVFTVI
jgi:hypothetical protein